MLEKLKLLETISRQLETPPNERNIVRNKVIEYTEDFLKNIYEVNAYNLTEDKGKGIYNSSLTEKINIDEAIKIFKENVDHPGLNPASGGHLGYIPGGGIFLSSLGDYLADITNRYAGIFFASPGAVRMENMLLRWMCETVGYGKDAGGNLTSGGSIANLIGITTARDAQQLKAKDFEKSVVYLTKQVHHSVDKALRIAGLGEVIKRYVPIDEKFRMAVGELEKLIIQDKQNGLNPFLVIASAGTTDTGAVDPLSEIGDIAKRNYLWFHIDAAYGGFFILCEEGKKILKGFEKSDSIVIDPHKGLFLPYGLGAILVKDAKKLFDAHYYQAQYLQDTLSANEELSPADLSPELTKHFRGLRLWLPLKLLGLAPFIAALEEKILLSRYFYEEMKKINGFELGNYPDLSVVLYRYVPKSGDANKFNEKLIKEIHKDGRVFLSSTMIEGKFYLRIAILSFRTHKDTIDLAIEVLKEKIRILSQK